MLKFFSLIVSAVLWQRADLQPLSTNTTTISDVQVSGHIQKFYPSTFDHLVTELHHTNEYNLTQFNNKMVLLFEDWSEVDGWTTSEYTHHLSCDGRSTIHFQTIAMHPAGNEKVVDAFRVSSSAKLEGCVELKYQDCVRVAKALVDAAEEYLQRAGADIPSLKQTAITHFNSTSACLHDSQE